MSLLKKQNKFEESMKAKLSELETKPSDALWAKLEKELDTDSFEPALRAKFDDFSIPVSENTWNNIEAQLPQEKNKKRILAFWFTGIFLGALSLGFFASKFYFNPELAIQTPTQVQNQTKVPNASIPPVINNNSPEVLPATQDQTSNNRNSGISSENSEEMTAVEANNNSLNTLQREELQSVSMPSNAKQGKQKSNLKNLVSSFASASSSASGSTPVNPSESIMPPSASKKSAGDGGNNSANQIPVVPNQSVPQQASQANNKTGELAETPKSEVRQLQEANAKVKLEDVQIKFANDSIVRGREAYTENYQTEDDKLTRYSISAMVGVYRTEMLLSKPSSSIYDLDKAFDLRTKLERASVDWSGGFLLNYHLNERWMISSGVQITNIKQALHYDLADPLSDTFNQVQSQNLYLHPTDSIIEGHVKTLENKYSFTEIPIWFTYSFRTEEKIGVDLMLGYSFAFLTSVNAYMPDPACVGLLNVNDKASFPTIKGSSFINIAPAVNYRINNSVQLGLMPQFKLGLSSVIDNKNWIQEKPLAIGLNFYLRKRF